MRTNLLALLITAAAMAAPVAPASATLSEGALNDFAKCAVTKDRAATAAAARKLPLNSDPATVDAASLHDAASCAKGAPVEAKSMMLRGAIAQALYRIDFRDAGMEPRTPVRNFADLGWPAIGDKDPHTDQGVALFKLADCIARNDVNNVDVLMRYPFGSDNAHKLLDKMQPYIQACFPKGATITVGRDTLHAAIAQGAYYASTRLWSGKLTAVKEK